MPAEITIFNPDGLGRPLGQYSQITRVKNASEWLFIAGRGVNLGAKDEQGRTALDIAHQRGNTQLAQLLARSLPAAR